MDNVREQRGLAIAATMLLRKRGDKWIVPSQSRFGVAYTVTITGSATKCTCPDYEAHHETCKHGYAVTFTIKKESTVWGEFPAITETTRVTYTQNWPAYNQAQTSEKSLAASLLRDLCSGIEQPPQRRGRPRLPLKDVTFAAVMKVFTTVSGRRATSDLRECQAKGQIDHTPHYNSVFSYLENPALTPLLKMLVEETAAPLKGIEQNFAIDSSGLSTSVFERWYEEKWGRGLMGGRQWIKVHLMVGVTTNIVTSVEVTGPEIGDAGQLPALLEKTAKRFAVSEVSADKGYLSGQNMDAIHKAGATPYIAFKSNSTDHSRSETWRKMFHMFQFNRDQFLARYHQRSNVESTFSMLKRKFGASIRSKTPVAQVNEVLCKVICHNLAVLVQSIHEFGIKANFWDVR